MYLSTITSTEDFPEMYLSTFQVLYKLYLSTDVLKYKVLLPGSDRFRAGFENCIAARRRRSPSSSEVSLSMSTDSSDNDSVVC